MEQNVPSTPAKKSSDIRKAELERKSRNLYTVFNPTNQDHQVILNARVSPEVWTIEAKKESVVPWYVAEKYFDEMTQKIITSKSDKAIIKENEKREEKGFPAMNLHTEQLRFENRNLKTMMGKRERIVKILNRGLYKEYGIGEDGKKIDKREQKATFDPGVDASDPQESDVPTKEVSEPPKPTEPVKSKPKANESKSKDKI